MWGPPSLLRGEATNLARRRLTLFRLGLFVVLLATLLLVGAGPASGWTSSPQGANGLSTHEWILHEANRISALQGYEWANMAIAQPASDEPVRGNIGQSAKLIDRGNMRLRHTLLVAGFVALAVLALGALAVGCGGDTTTTTAATESTATTATTATETTASTEAKMYRIGITQIVQHPALDAVVEGFKEQMAAAGYVEGENVTYDLQNAQGEMSNASAIAQKFASDKLDLVLSIATPTSQTAVKEITDFPVLFAAVTDPVAAGLVKDPAAPDANVTGVSDLLPVGSHLELIKQLVPDVKTIGLLYNSGESNSVALVELEKAKAEEMGLEVVEATAATPAEVLTAARSLVGRVDAISVLTDNTVVSAFESVVKVCTENKIPLIAGDTDSVKRGAIAAYAFDYKQHGVQAAKMAVKILEGTPIKDIPVEYAENLMLSLNLASAEAMGVTIPDALKSEAAQTF